MTKILLAVLISLCGIVSDCEGSKILFFFAGGSYSHKSSAWAWATELSNRGHEITFFSPYEKKPSENTKIQDIASKALHTLMSDTYDIDRFAARREWKQQNMLATYGTISKDICKTLLQTDPIVKPLIHNSTFDLVVVNIIYGECGLLFASKYQAKTILYDASVTLPWFYDTYGYLPATSWIPDTLVKFQNFPMSYVERLYSTFWPLYWYLDRCYNIYPYLEELMKEAFNVEKVSPFLELERNVSLVLVNSHPAIDFAFTLPPMIQMIGGVQTWMQEKPIPQKYQDFMDAAGPDGVVLISFGSTINLEKVPIFYQTIFFKLIRKYENVRFLMKWNGSFPEGFEKGLQNLMVTDWLPQRELLRHPNLQAFVTHGGLNSLQEATHYGVPLIVLPLFADQDYNAYRIEAQEVGFRLEIRDLNFEIMDKALGRILSNPKYKKNMQTKSRIFRDRPQSPLETVIYWTEFVLRHDDLSSLKPMSAHLNWFQLRNLDVYLLCFTIGIIMLLIVGLILTQVTSRLFTSSSKPKKPTHKAKSS